MPTPEASAARIERLEAAIERLSQNVIALSTSLALIGEINDRQAQLEVRTAETESKADSAVIRQHAFDEELLTVHAANTRWRAWIVTSLVVIIALLGYVRYESVDQIGGRLQANKSLCEAANAHIQYEIELIESSPSPDHKAVVAAANGLKGLKRDCNKLFGPQNKPSYLGF